LRKGPPSPNFFRIDENDHYQTGFTSSVMLVAQSAFHTRICSRQPILQQKHHYNIMWSKGQSAVRHLVDRDGLMAGWTGCDDDHAGYLAFSH
jgi:hypothetical protein